MSLRCVFGLLPIKDDQTFLLFSIIHQLGKSYSIYWNPGLLSQLIKISELKQSKWTKYLRKKQERKTVLTAYISTAEVVLLTDNEMWNIWFYPHLAQCAGHRVGPEFISQEYSTDFHNYRQIL